MLKYLFFIIMVSSVVYAQEQNALVKPSILAPGPEELSQALLSSKKLLHDTEVVNHTVARLQNRIAELRILNVPQNVCEHSEMMSLVAREVLFLKQHRDWLQSARIQQKRLERLQTSLTIEPLLDTAMREQLLNLQQRLNQQLAQHLEFSAWHKRFIQPLWQQCKPKISAAEGLTNPIFLAPNEQDKEVAIIALKGGMICPMRFKAEDNVMIVPEGLACYSSSLSRCACELKEVFQGAVLGP